MNEDGTVRLRLKGLLGAEEALDDAESTGRFLRAVRDFSRDQREALGAEGRRKLERALTGALAQERVDVEGFTENAVPGALRGRLREIMDDNLPDCEFAVDGRGARSAPPVVFRGSNGLRVSVEGSYADEMIDAHPSPGGGYVIQITTAEWELGR